MNDASPDQTAGQVPNPDRRNNPEKAAAVEIDVDTIARDAAERKLVDDYAELHGVGGFVGKIWKHNLFYDYYREKEIIQARSVIQQEGVYANESDDLNNFL